ncbi:hypothetical protein [Conyzicola sp.]|uniref:hypothetical protein n=1 Tax=Conyzicola sp. TaxID=1969404 RepID=UPI00398A15A3
MDIDYAELFFNALLNALGAFATGFGAAFYENPWPFLGLAAIVLVGFLVPKKRPRRRRRA